jgi:tetratricopeptide (TPR) repeat protein
MAWQERGKIKYGMRDYAGAAQDFSKAAELSKTDAAAAYWLAMAFFKTGYLDGALESALAAEKLKDDSHLTAGLLGDIYAGQGDSVKDKEYYLKAAGLSEKYSAYYKGRLAAMGSTGKKR